MKRHDEFDELPAEVIYDQALDKALKLLTKRARSRFDVSERLRRSGFEADVVNRVLDRLNELGIINDREFATEQASYAAVSRGESDRLIKFRLKAQGVATDEIERAIVGVGEENPEFQRALELGIRRARVYRSLDPTKARRRLASFLASKGYGYETVFDVCRKVLKEQESGEFDPNTGFH